MNNFKLLRANIDTTPFLAEINDKSEAWLRRTSRQRMIFEHGDTQSIFLREPKLLISPKFFRRLLRIDTTDIHRSIWTSDSIEFPKLCGFMTDFASEHRGALGRAIIVRLKPGGKVYSHIDEGEYYKKTNRYHLVLHSPSGSLLNCGTESAVMKNGELWWFDNKQMHSAVNEDSDWRIHLIFDMRSYLIKP